MSESGIGIQNPLFFVGVIEGNIDPRLEGRVQVRAFGIHGTIHQIPSAELPWAPVLNGIIPPLNAWVMGMFIDGRDAQQPVVIGVIPTQMNVLVDPEQSGWGVIAQTNNHLLAQGSRPEDFGQPTIPRLARGEYIEQTYVPAIEAAKENNIPVAGTTDTWSEPGSAYDAQYPFNKVIETAGGHSVELDDTPGAERIMVYHNSGSYIQIDMNGTTSDKAVGDRYQLTDGNMHVFVGGSAKVTVEQDAHLLVGGNMFQEVMGDMNLSVHGNFDIASGGQINMYAADQIQISGTRIAASATTADVDVLAASDIKITAGANANLKGGSDTNISSGGQLSLGASGNVAIDGAEVRALEGASKSATASEGASTPAPISGASFNNSIRYSSIGSSDIYSPDTGTDAMYEDSVSENSIGEIEPMTSSPQLIEFIKQYEGQFQAKAFWDHKQYSIGYGTKANSPNEVITESEAMSRLQADVSQRRAYVSRYSTSRGRNWNDDQIDALTSFIYNGGEGWLDQVTNGNRRTDEEVATMMLEYNKASGKVSPGLLKRRKAESAWFRKGMASNTQVTS